MNKPCPHCQVMVEACPMPCGEWDCAYHAHLGSDCPSEKGIEYRMQIKVSVARRDNMQPKVELRVTMGTVFGFIVLELWPDKAPKTVKNFLTLIAKRFYDGLLFHRVINDFMIQGGCPNTKDLEKRSQWGHGNAGYMVRQEFNNAPFLRGVLGAARGLHVDSASCQFFICHKDSLWLNGQYTAFGKVTDEAGLKVLDWIAGQPTTKDVPNEPIEMSFRILEDSL